MYHDVIVNFGSDKVCLPAKDIWIAAVDYYM